MDTVGEGKGGTKRKSNTETYTSPYGKQGRGNLLYDAGSATPGFGDNLEGWGEVQEGRGMCIPTAGSHSSMAEANTIL